MTNINKDFSKIYSLIEEYYSLLKDYSNNLDNISEKDILDFNNKTGLTSLYNFFNEHIISKKIKGGGKKDWVKNKVGNIVYYENKNTGKILLENQMKKEDIISDSSDSSDSSSSSSSDSSSSDSSDSSSSSRGYYEK